MSKIKEKFDELMDLSNKEKISLNTESRSEEIIRKAKEGKIDCIMELAYDLIFDNIYDSIMCFEIASEYDLYKSTAYLELGIIYNKYINDNDKAIAYLKKSCELGNVYAKCYLGRLYLHNNPEKIPRIYEAAFDYLKEAYESGCDEAKIDLAYCYQSALGTEKNLELAKQIYEALGDFYTIGSMYWMNDDFEQAIIYLEKNEVDYYYADIILADCYARCDRLKDALDIFNEYMSSEDKKEVLLDFFDAFPFILDELKIIFDYTDIIS